MPKSTPLPPVHPALPVPSDLQQLLSRLEREERDLVRRLAELEEQIRRFEDLERPAYEAWLRVELGPKLSALEELYEQIRAKQILVRRIERLVELDGLHPREALYVASGNGSADAFDKPGESPERPAPGSSGPGSADAQHGDAWDADEIEARRRAKREAKRQARKQQRREARATHADSQRETSALERGKSPRRKLVALYRALARRLHPDSSEALPASERRQRLWHEVQAAYEASDLERLLAVDAWLGGESPLPRTSDKSTVAERFERLRALGISRFKLQKTMVRLRTHPAWGFGTDGQASASQKRKLRRQAEREIEAELTRAHEALTAYEDFVDSIGPPRPPRAGRGDRPSRRGPRPTARPRER